MYLFNPFVTNRKSNGESRHLNLSPLVYLKNVVDEPSIKIAKETILQARFNLVYECNWKPYMNHNYSEI